MKVLLVDDHVLFREGVALLLRPMLESPQIVEANCFEEALRAMEHNSDVDLALVDLGLPGMPGLEGIRALKERYPTLPVVALSSSEDKHTVLQAVDAGAMGFIPKSSSSGVLAGALKVIMSNGIYLPPAIFLAEREAPFRPSSSAPSTRLGLTPRQSDVLLLILQGKSAKIISRELGLSASTVKIHTSAVLRALNVTTRTQAVIAAGRLGLKFPPMQPI